MIVSVKWSDRRITLAFAPGVGTWSFLTLDVSIPLDDWLIKTNLLNIQNPYLILIAKKSDCFCGKNDDKIAKRKVWSGSVIPKLFLLWFYK